MPRTTPKSAALGALLLATLAGAPLQAQRDLLLVGRIDLADTEDAAPPAPIHLRILGPRHPELPGEAVLALEPPWEHSLEADLEAGARVFRIAVPHPGPFLVEAVDEAGRRGRCFPLMAGQFGALRLESWPEFSGKVVDLAGEPVAGAHVGTGGFALLEESYHQQLLAAPPRETVTDADGVFRLPVPPASSAVCTGDRGLFAWTDELRSSERYYVVQGMRQLDDELVLGSDRMVEGRARWSGDPLDLALIQAVTQGGPTVGFDRDGLFRIDAHRARTLWAHAEGHASLAVNLSVARETHGQVLVSLRTGVGGRFRVLRSGAPLAHARVVLASIPRTATTAVAWTETTDAQGWVESRRFPQHLGFTAHVETDDGFLPVLASAVTIRGPAFAELGQHDVAHVGAVQGRILDPDGVPLAGARLLWRPEGPGFDRALPKRVTFTDHVGRFRFDRVLRGPGMIAVAGGASGYAQFDVGTGGEAETDVGDLAMPVGHELTGRVRDEHGAPCPGAAVSYRLQVSLGGVGEAPNAFGRVALDLRADAEGRFRIRGLPLHPSAEVVVEAVDAEGRASIGGAAYGLMEGGGPWSLDVKLAPHRGRR